MRFIVIGVSDNPQPWFPPEVLEMIKQGKVFSGGKRHHEIVASLLPSDAQWIDITVPLDAVFEQYLSSPIIVFASGDPLFFGFANTIQRKMPDAEIVVYPSFNSLQLLAHRLVLPYHDMRIVSLTGRPWPEFDKALIERVGKIGVLTDREHTPSAIAQRMIEYGYTSYQMHVGEHLGNPELEKVSTLTLEEAAKREVAMPNCVILKGAQKEPSPLCTRFGIPDADFALLDGREKFPHLQVCAFEIRPECEALIRENARRFGAPGIDVHIGDFLETDISGLPRPDAIFIGGHGGHLKEIMAKVLSVLAPDGVIVFNSVSSPVVDKMTDRPSSRQLWNEACLALHFTQDPPLQIQLNDYNPIEILKARVRT